ncbi:MAG TPA: hypothetical protein VFK33_07280 [Bacillales bacterium]|nr:hypothetical protein [Bacillales bacterium]
MAGKTETARRPGLWFLILFVIIILAVALFGAYARWINPDVMKWGADIPVLSTFYVEGTQSEKVPSARTKLLKSRLQEEQKKISDLQRSMNSKEDRITQLKDQIAVLQKNATEQSKKKRRQKSTSSYENVAEVYSNMDPGSAAAILSQLKNQETIQILTQLDPDITALILSKMKPDRAAKLTTLLAEKKQSS